MERFIPGKIEDIKPKGEQAFKEEFVPNENTKHKGQTEETKPKVEQFIKFHLSEDERLMKRSELAKKLGVTPENADYFKRHGYYTKPNPEFVFSRYSDHSRRERVAETKDYLSSITETKINSIESALGDKEVQKELADLVDKFKDVNHFATRFLPEESRFNKKFKLSNGDEVLIGDLTLLNLFAKSNVFRDASGKLQVFDPEKNTQKPFAMTDVSKAKNRPFIFSYAHINGQNKGKRTERIYPSSFAFWSKVAPNAVKQGVLRKEDFRFKPAHSEGYQVFGGHERTLKNRSSVYFSNEDGKASYYIGRDKFVGTEKKINRDTVSLILLDNKTVGIVDNVHGKKEILFTFPLMGKDEYENKRNFLLNKFKNENRVVKEKEMGTYITANADEMKERVKEYSITNYIKQKQNESAIQYAERISRLSDVGYTLGQFREFMAEAGVGAQNFKWEEQLVLADAFTSVKNKEIILDFAQKFGENGLRTFLSVEHGGRPMGSKIIEVGNNINENIAKEVFSKYGEIVDSAKSVGEEIQNLFTNKNLPQDKIDKIKEQLLERAKNLLISCADNKKNEIGVAEELERIKKDIMITGMAFKELYKNGDSVALEDIEGMSFESLRAQDLSAKDKVEMAKIYEMSRPAVTFKNAKHIKILLDEFKTNLEKENTFIYNVKVNGKIMAFATFYKTNPDTLHVGGLSFHPDVKNPAVGVAVMDSMLKDLGKYNIEAEVHSKNQILAMYTKRFGFKITKELPNLDDSGELYYLVEREKNTKQNQEKIAT